MATSLIVLLINVFGICVANSVSVEPLQADSLGNKEVVGETALPSTSSEDTRRRSPRIKRVVLPRHDVPPLPVLNQPRDSLSTELPTNTRTQRNKALKGSRNKKKGIARKPQKSLSGTERKSKKQGKSKKMNQELMEIVEGISLPKTLPEDTRRRSPRNKRVILPRHDAPPLPVLTQPRESLPTEQPADTRPQRNKAPKGTRNKKKGDARKSQKSLPGTERKSKKQGKSKKMNPENLREGQSPRRLRQHMQHKKKVKQFLQKRIQQQIEQRSQNPSFAAE